MKNVKKYSPEALERQRERVRVWMREHRHGGNHASDRAEIDRLARRDSYVCARCGKTFTIPDITLHRKNGRAFVMLGGKKVCEACAHRRFKRRVDFNATFDPASIP